MSEKKFTTDSLSPKGRGCVLEKKVEVIGALDGEEVMAQLGPKKKQFRLAFLREILSPSEDRVEARCLHFPHCGGCSLQQMDYFAQLEKKQALVFSFFSDLIEHFDPKVHPILGCENPWRYRNKMEFSFSENKEGEKFLGLILAGSRGRVINLKECYLVSDWYIEALNKIRSWWEESSLSAYNHRNDTGHLLYVMVREAKKGKGKMVMLTVSGNPGFALKKSLLDSFVDLFREEEEMSVFVQVRQIGKGRPTQFFEMLLFGKDHITERLDIELFEKNYSLDFKISPTSFFQPNTLQAERLYSEALQLVPSLSGALVFDLYCGGATLGLAAAQVAKEVVGIEINPHSVFDATWNQEVNGVENFSIHRGDVGTILEEKKLPSPDVIIVDPPRAGLDDRAMNEVLSLSAKVILYISCNPKTQAENAQVLADAGYRLKVLQPVDQFPHTFHIENIALFEKE